LVTAYVASATTLLLFLGGAAAGGTFVTEGLSVSAASVFCAAGITELDTTGNMVIYDVNNGPYASPAGAFKTGGEGLGEGVEEALQYLEGLL
jgi:hypothetical protein